MEIHQETFAVFLEKIGDLDYVCIRGFINLPNALDTDVDVVFSLEHFDSMMDIAKSELAFMATDYRDFGFAEWCNMIYAPFFTLGDHDSTIPNGRFRVDTYNSLYFASPHNNFTTNWTVPKKFNDLVLQERVKRDNYYVPCPEHEILLLICRDVFDKQGVWADKHVLRMFDLMTNISRDKFLAGLEMLKFPEKVLDHLEDGDYTLLSGTIMGTV